jgi:tetratricopeptide (TPR) repeat protein
MLKVIDLDPNYSDAYDRLGRFYLFDKKDSEQSLKYLQKYSELNRNEYSLYHLGIAFSRLKQFDKAMKYFIDAQNIVISNKSADTWIIDNLKWAIENTENNEPLFF